mgnify:FL=1
MNTLSLDFETYCDKDIKKTGAYRYIRDPSFAILLTAYSINGGPVVQIDHTEGETFPDMFVERLFDPTYIKRAWNATFEWYVLCKVLNVHDPINWLRQWQDTMICSLYCGFPASLGAAGDAMGLPQDKKKDAQGKALIRYFCTPRKATKKNAATRNFPIDDPEKWQTFKDYNKQDVVTEMFIGNRLYNFAPTPEVWADWRLDQQINAHGVRVDEQLIDGAIYCFSIATAEAMEKAKELSGLQNPKSVQQLTAWIQQESDGGVELENLRKDTVSETLKTTDNEKIASMLKLRQELGKTSVKKYASMQNAVCGDHRVRGLLQYYGAQRTGRWAGRLVQVQNLPQNHLPALSLARDLIKAKNINGIKFMFGNIPDTLSQLIRTAFVPSEGCEFAVADFSAIEARVIAWFAGEKWRQDVFSRGGKIYEESAASMFGVPVESIKKGDPLRQRGKVAELALGYQGGVGALKTMDRNHEIPEEDMPDIVRRWRAASPRICDLWYKMQEAALDTIETGRANVVQNKVTFRREIDAANGLDFLTLQLPSGRRLFYDHPIISYDDRGRPRIQYHGADQKTHRWTALDTYGGKLVENAVQAIARDCLAVSMERLAAAGFQIVFHVHDEVILDCPKGRWADPYAAAVDIMRQPIPWAQGLILNADGFTASFYKKD